MVCAPDTHWPTRSGPSRGPCSFASLHCTWLTFSLWEEEVYGGEGEGGVSQWKTQKPRVQGGGSCMWFMINGASPITFKLRASLKHGSSRRARDRLCSWCLTPITMTTGAGTSSALIHRGYHPHIFMHARLNVNVWVCEKKKKNKSHWNKCECITVRLRVVQRANAYYYINAGWTPPYTQQSIKSRGDGGRAADQNRWEKKERERERKEGGKKAMLEGNEAWLTWIGA